MLHLSLGETFTRQNPVLGTLTDSWHTVRKIFIVIVLVLYTTLM